MSLMIQASAFGTGQVFWSMLWFFLFFIWIWSGHMRPATLTKVYYPARSAAGRPDLRFHDLRLTGATLPLPLAPAWLS